MDRIRLKIFGVSYSMSQNGAYALILSDETELKRIPIVIGMSEAQSIATQLENIHPQRPLTHDLIKGITDIKLEKENDDGTKQYSIAVQEGLDIRKSIFADFAKENLTIFEMKKADSSLEEAFMKLLEKGEKK